MGTKTTDDSEKEVVEILEETENTDVSDLEDNEIIGNDGEIITLDKD